ncbi:MAG: hypothetical protein ACKV19_20435 [Verrucomicrobiales bacterium]
MKEYPSIGTRSLLPFHLLALVFLAVPSLAQVTPIIERGEEWRYLDTGVTPPAIGGVSSWKASNYNAAAAGSPWKAGRGLFGYGDNINYGTPLIASNPATPNNKYLTHYFWKSFQIPATAVFGTTASATYSGFQIKVYRDDAVAVYVNGQEISMPGPTRDNLPSGAITNTTAALNPVEGQSETSPVVFVDLRDLLNKFPQTNTIAVELHQQSNATSDARFDLAMDLVTAEPCFGDSRAGVSAIFSEVGRGVSNGIIHERDPIEEPSPPDYSFDEQDTEMNWRTTASGDANLFFGPTQTDYVTSAELPSNALGFWFGSPLTWESEAIDVRSFKDVFASARVLGVKRTGVSWASGDRLEFILRVSGDGISYRDVPWMRITSTTSTGTATAWTDLVAENAVKRAIVPTAANNPLNTGGGNWRTRAFNDSAWPSGTKGTGYENSPTDSTNYADLIDPALDFKNETYGASPRKSVIYMRCVFSAQPDRATFNSLRLLMRFDDGFVAYLNDQEVARKFVATSSVPTVPTALLPTPSSLASQGNADTNAVIFEEFNLTSHLTKISTTEQNVLAIYALNDKVDSSDLVAWPVLQMGKPGGPPPVSLNSITPTITENRPFTVEDYTRIDSTQSGPNGTNLIPAGTQAVRLRIVGTLTGSLTDKAYYVDDINFGGTATIPDTFDNFMAVQAPTASAEDRLARGDLEGDSIMNIHEYAFATNPTVPALHTEVNAVLKPIAPEVFTDSGGFAYIRFRLAGGSVTGNPGTGYQILDLNVRPQISFGGFGENDWKDEVNSIAYFLQDGPFVENNDGTVTVTCRTIEQEARDNPTLYLRLRVGVRYPGYLNGIDTNCYRP